MGRGIAYAAALGGYNTVLEDVSRQVLEQGVAWIKQSFEEAVVRGKVEGGVRDEALFVDIHGEQCPKMRFVTPSDSLKPFRTNWK